MVDDNESSGISVGELAANHILVLQMVPPQEHDLKPNEH